MSGAWRKGAELLSFELSLNLRAALVVREFPLGHQPRRDLVDRLRLAVLVHPRSPCGLLWLILLWL